MVTEVVKCEEWFNILSFSVLHFIAKINVLKFFETV